MDLGDLLGEGMELDGTTLGAYVHTTHGALEEAFRFAGVDATSCVVDIGCGDGRAAIVAASRFHCHAVGGLDCDADLVVGFANKARQVLAREVSEGDTTSTSSHALAPSESKYFCVAADALAWGKQSQLFYTKEELAAIPPRTVVHSTDTDPNKPPLLPAPTHIYLYILQHRLKFLVPVLHRIRAELPGVVIVSAFEFKVRPETATEHDDDEDYLDVPVASSFIESKGRITFRVYK